ncbi:RNA-directed DNA polymerase [Mycobacterium malmoense]|uniref:RNA-directed DNA polymerase n=1 Tax=Mycobacterium malmoense TaxID=1780 RepID=UPI00267D033C
MAEIPNPFSQEAITRLCSRHWRTLQRITAQSPISLSRPVKRSNLRWLTSVGDRSIRPVDIAHRMPGGVVTLKTDISQFYPSIYTHAVDWAVRGKAIAKRRRTDGSLGAQLDKVLRFSRGGQTVGLSIGPDTSWLVAEMVLGRVDAELCKEDSWIADHAFRFGDDMTLYARSRAHAETVLAKYAEYLAKYELSLNPSKVALIDGLEHPDRPWVTTLRQFRYRSDTPRHLSQDIVDLFATAFELARENPSDGVLSYAMKRCDPFPAQDAWHLYREFVLAAMVQEPTAVRHVYQILTFARDHSLPIRDDRLEQVINQMCADHSRLNHGFEVAWILTMARDLDIPLDNKSVEAVAEMDDNCSLLLLIDLVQRGQVYADISKPLKRAEAEGALSSNDWLLAYECRANRWCRPKKWDDKQEWKDLYSTRARFLVPKGLSQGRRRLRRRRPDFMPSWGGS